MQGDLAALTVDDDRSEVGVVDGGEDDARLGCRGAGGEGDLHAIVVDVQLRAGELEGSTAGQRLHVRKDSRPPYLISPIPPLPGPTPPRPWNYLPYC